MSGQKQENITRLTVKFNILCLISSESENTKMPVYWVRWIELHVSNDSQHKLILIQLVSWGLIRSSMKSDYSRSDKFTQVDKMNGFCTHRNVFEGRMFRKNRAIAWLLLSLLCKSIQHVGALPIRVARMMIYLNSNHLELTYYPLPTTACCDCTLG